MEILIHKNALNVSQEELEKAMLICGPSNRNAWLKPKLTKILQKYAYLENDIFMPKVVSAIDDTNRLFLIARDWNITIDNNLKVILSEMQNPDRQLNKMYQTHTLRIASDFADKWCIYSRHAVIAHHNKYPTTRLADDDYLDIIKHPKDWLYLEIELDH